MNRCVCKKKFSENIRWGMEFTFYINAERYGADLRIHFYISDWEQRLFMRDGNPHESYIHRMTLESFETHMVVIDKEEFESYIQKLQFFNAIEKEAILKRIGRETPCPQAQGTNATTNRNVKLQNVGERLGADPSRVTLCATVQDVNFRRLSDDPNYEEKTSTISAALKLGTPVKI